MAESSRCSSRAALVVLFCLVLVTVPVVGAVTTSVEESPQEAEVGTQVTSTVMLSNLYREPNLEEWALSGETELVSVTWTVTLLDQGGNQIATQSYDGQSFRQDGISLDAGVGEVRVKVTGVVPEVDDFRYDPHQSFRMMDLTQTREGGTSTPIGNWSVEHFTRDSRAARNAIDNATTAIENARDDGADTSSAESTREDAIEAYETRSFNLAVDLAREAERQANNAGQSAERTRLIIFGAIGVVLIGGLVGVVYWYQTREQPYDRLG